MQSRHNLKIWMTILIYLESLNEVLNEDLDQ